MTSHRAPRARRRQACRACQACRASRSAYRHRGLNGPDPRDVLCVILSIALLLASAFVLGGLLAHPFG